MASGAILGTCQICNELICEDEWDIFGDDMIHERCKRKAAAKAIRVSEEHYDTLSKIKKIENEINFLKQDLINNFEYYKKQITELENTLEKMKSS